MKVNSIIPGLNLVGGLEGFARDVSNEISKSQEISLFDYKNNLSFSSKAIMRILPKRLSAILFNIYYSKFLKDQYPKFNDNSIFHFWHIEPSILFLDKNYVITCHGNEILTKNLTSFREELYKKSLDNAIIIHTNSEYTKNYITKNYSINPNKIIVIPPFIYFNKLSKIKRIKHKKIILGTISRLVERKNVINIIKSLNILKEKYNIEFIYYLAGDGSEKKQILRELKKAKFDWKYLGKINDKEKLNKFYPSLDAFIMPPLELKDSVEGFGIVYLEANSYGIPVIASKTGGVGDAVKDNFSGVFAEPTSPEDIARKIFYVIKNKDKFKPKEWAKKFDKKIIIKRFEKMYEKIIQESKKINALSPSSPSQPELNKDKNHKANKKP